MAKKKTKKSKVNYGKVELDKDEFDPKYAKIRITTFVDLDVVETLKKSAKKLNTKYQTLLNEKLRQAVFGEKTSYELMMSDLLGRIENLEKKVG